MTPALAVLPDRRALAAEAARLVVERARAAAAERGVFRWALAGGSTPRDLYRLLADPHARCRGEMPWQRTHVFWGDERNVPPDHGESNFRMAREAMLDHVPVPAANVHRILGEEPAERAAKLYEAELRAAFGADAAMSESAAPRFDLVLLGLGADGHTASLFPGSSALDERARWVAAPYVPALAAFRITLTLPAINGAAAVLFLVAGADKAEAVRAVLAGDEPPAVRPARAVHPRDGELLWRIDHAAARDLS